MITRNEFEEYIKSLIPEEERTKLNSKLKANNKTARVAGIITLISLACFFLIVPLVMVGVRFNGFMEIIMILAFILFSAAITTMIFNSKASTELRKIENIYKDDIINFLFKDYKHNYNRFGGIERELFEVSQMGNSSRIDEYRCEDFLSINIPNDDGTPSDVKLNLCDIYAYYETKDADGDTDRYIVYDGVFGYAQLPFNFKSTLTINTTFRTTKKLDAITLEDVSFNKLFKIKCSDQIEARYILTPEVMLDLMKLKTKMGKIKLILSGDMMFIGFPNQNLFHFNGTSEKSFLTVFNQSEAIVNLITKIAQNNKVFKF